MTVRDRENLTISNVAIYIDLCQKENDSEIDRLYDLFLKEKDSAVSHEIREELQHENAQRLMLKSISLSLRLDKHLPTKIS